MQSVGASHSEVRFAIHKRPAKVLLLGLFGFGLYFVLAVEIFRASDYYFFVLGAGALGLVIHLVTSIGSYFVSTYTVTDQYIETVTSVGGIIRINFKELDWDRTEYSEAGLLLKPTSGESMFLSILEYSPRDIAKLANLVAAERTEAARKS